MASQKSSKFQGCSLLKPKPVLRIGVSGHAAARLGIFKSLTPFITYAVNNKAKKISKMFDFEAKADSKNRHRQTRCRYL
jgi:hypothetical protein